MYYFRFESRFSAKNLLFLNQLSFCLKKLIKFIGGTSKSNPDDKQALDKTSKLHTLEEFEILAEIDTINLFKLIDFVKNSKLAYKLQNYMDRTGSLVTIHETKQNKSGVTNFLNSLQGKEVEVEKKPNDDNVRMVENQSNNSLMTVMNFFECLKNSCADGRIFLLPASTIGQSALKFVLLNPAAHFTDIGKFFYLKTRIRKFSLF